MKKIYSSIYYMAPGDNSVSMEVAGGSIVLPDPATVPAGEVGDVYILTAPLGGYISNSTRSQVSAVLTGSSLNTTNFPTSVNCIFDGANIFASANGASFTSRVLTPSASNKFSTVDFTVKYKPQQLSVTGTSGNLSFSGATLVAGQTILVTVNGATFPVTVVSPGSTVPGQSTWGTTPLTSANNNNNWSKIIFDGSKYIALSGGGTSSRTYAISTDGKDWDFKNLPLSLRYSGIVFNGSRYLAVADGSSKVSISTDLINWTLSDLPAARVWCSLIWTGTQFVVLSTDGFVARSTNGTSWTETKIPTVGKYSSISFGGGTYLVTQGHGSPSKVALTSTNLTSWTQVTLPITADSSNSRYLSGKFFITFKGSNRLLFSTSGATGTWTQVTLPKLADWMDIDTDGTTFAVCTTNNPASPIVTSTDLVTWTAEPIPTFVAGQNYDTISLCFGAYGFKAICRSYDAIVSRVTRVITTGATFSPPIVGVPSSVVIGGQTSDVAFDTGTGSPTSVPMTYSAPDSNGIVTARFTSQGPASRFQFKFNLNVGDLVSEVSYKLFEESAVIPTTVLDAGVQYAYVTDGVSWYPISQGNSVTPTNPSSFPVPGNPNNTYVDNTTNISYRWDPVTNSYVTAGDGRLYQFPTRSAFPTTGVEFNKYLDTSTGVEYYWDTSRTAYLVTGGGDIPIGTILPLFGSVIPHGYLELDGSSFNIITYPFLHSWLTANVPSYVSGTLPDFRNMHLRGTDGTRPIGDYQADAIVNHNHTGSITGGGFATATVIGSTAGLYNGNGNIGDNMPGGSWGISVGNVINAPTAPENRVKNIAVRYIIKAVNGFTDVVPQKISIAYYATNASFPLSGDATLLYVDTSTNKPYRWDSGTSTYSSLGWGDVNMPVVTVVNTSPFVYSTGDILDVQTPNAVISIPAQPAGKKLLITNAAAAHNTILNVAINGSTTNSSLINPYNSLEIISVGYEFRTM